MMDILWYFDRLGIAPTEEERAIRRSYAIALKRIDQETQPKEFEQLRRAYELALQWRESNDAFDEEGDGTDGERADEVAIDAPERGTSPFGGSTHDSESPAFDTAARPLARVSVSRVERLESADSVASAAEQPALTAAVVVTRGAQPQVTGRNQISAHGTDSSPRADYGTTVHALFHAFVRQLTANPSQAAALLAATIRDDALIPIGARAQFEDRLAAWLHDHPHPNHALFDAAVAQFGWREHLPEVDWNTQFWLKQTVDEWCHWNSEDLDLRIQVLRATEAAEKGNIRRISRNDLLAHARALALAQARYPRWLHLRLTDAQIDAWNTRVAQAHADDQTSCEKRIRNGAKAAFFSAGLGASLRIATGVAMDDPWALVDPALEAVAGLLMLCRSRVASTIIMILFVISGLANFFIYGNVAVQTLVCSFFLGSAVLATYRWQAKYRKPAGGRLNRSVGR
ncbi:hypothetical protein KNO81_39400 [Paraburkholderia sediminicola]|nr:hypothetical protein [Paraburkholderia sediminicola]